MGWVYIPLVLILMLGGLLVAAGIEDARRREIANWKNVAIAGLAPVWWWVNGLPAWPDMAIQLGIAGIVFAVFVAVFAAGWMGGGDVKLIGALALWLPLGGLALMLVVMALAGGVVTLLIAGEHHWRGRRMEGADRPPIEVPYGVAIAFAGLLAINEPILNQFTR